MADDKNVVDFPKVTKAATTRRVRTDEDHVTNVSRAWRALVKAVADARNSGLDVHTEFNIHNDEPRLSRHYGKRR